MKVKCLCISTLEELRSKIPHIYWLSGHKCNKCNYNLFYLAEYTQDQDLINNINSTVGK